MSGEVIRYIIQETPGNVSFSCGLCHISVFQSWGVMVLNRNEHALNKMKQLIDPDEYYKLRVFFAGETVYFPLSGELERQQRNEAIRQDREAGVTISKLVEMYGLSESQIRRIIRTGAVKKAP